MNGRRGRQISFCWVPAHVGVSGNEEADRLAKEGSLNCRPLKCAVPFSDFKPAIRLEINRTWQFYWDLEIRNKLREITTKIFPWVYPSISRKEEVVLCRLRIGHTRLTHGHLMSGDPQPYCEGCIVPLTIKHILLECPDFLEIRLRYLSHGKDGNGNFNLVKLIGEECNIEKIFKFLDEAGFYSLI